MFRTLTTVSAPVEMKLLQLVLMPIRTSLQPRIEITCAHRACKNQRHQLHCLQDRLLQQPTGESPDLLARADAVGAQLCCTSHMYNIYIQEV